MSIRPAAARMQNLSRVDIVDWWRSAGRQWLLAIVYGIAPGCGGGKQEFSRLPENPDSAYGDDTYDAYGYPVGEVKFLEDAPSNTAASPDVGLSDLTLTRMDGAETLVRDFLKDRGVVVVVTRGATDPICPYCSTQTAHYIRDYDQFRDRGIEILLVYPLETRQQEERLAGFLKAAQGRLQDPNRPVPFPVLFDVALTAVDKLGIRQDLSKPATYIIDAAGNVRYAYVGAHLADRPSTAAVLKELDQLFPRTAPEAAPSTGAAAQATTPST